MAWMLLDRQTLEPVQNRHVFIRPRSANLVELVKRSESDPSEDLSPSMSLQEALNQFETEVFQVFPDLEETCIVTAGTNSFKTKLFAEKLEHGLRLPNFFSSCRYFDVHQEGPYHLEIQSLEDPAQASALTEKTKRVISEVLEEDGSAMERCRKILDYLALIVHETAHPNILFDTIKDRTITYENFIQNESRNVLVSGLPSPVKYSDIEEILQVSDLALDQVMIPKLVSDSMFPGLLLVTMNSHTEALRALNLHGLKFENFRIEVSASSGDYIDSSLRVLESHRSGSPHDRSRSRSPGSPRHSGPPRQPTARGDWICQNSRCRTHNFSFRTTCLGCHDPKPENAEEVPAVVTRVMNNNGSSHQNVRAGDWFCPNRSCNFQNFSNRTTCLKCGEPVKDRAEVPRHSGYRGDNDGKVGYRTNQPIKPGDWICGGCKAHNFAHRDRCFQCGSGVPFSNKNSSGPPPRHSSSHHHSSSHGSGGFSNSSSYPRRDSYQPDMRPGSDIGNSRDYPPRDGPRGYNSRERSGRDYSSRGHGSRDFGSRGFGNREYGSRDFGSRDHGSRDFGSRDLGGRDFGNRDGGSRDFPSRDLDNREFSSRDPGNREFGNRDYNNRGSFRNNSSYGSRPGRAYDSYHPSSGPRDDFGPRRNPGYNRHGGSQFNSRSGGYPDRSSSFNRGGPSFNNRGPSYDQEPREPFQHKVMAGDWICSDETCRYHNFARRNTCGKCGKPNR